MYQAMISEIAKNKLENFKPSFDEINKKMSPSELLKNSEKNGISGDSSEQNDLKKLTEDTLKTRLKEELSKSNDELRNKDLFVANLSHEIKTPINIIVAMI